MLCPSCGERFADLVKHCTHCGIRITRRSVEIAQVAQNLGWIARRSLGGFFSGGVGWVLAIAVARTLSFAETGEVTFLTLLDFFPGKSPPIAAIAGAFIGTVGGMIERSAYKTVLGGVLGAIGGFLGGVCYPLFQNIFTGNKYAYSFAMAGAWGIAASAVGLTSGFLEGTRKKITMGLLGGLFGGILGGGVGSQMYGAILMEVGSAQGLSWFAGRMLEFVGGGIVGVHIWFFIGMTEKLYIFKRRRLVSQTNKICDLCAAENGLNAWYCAQCGAALQVAATRDQIRVTPYRGLERISNAFQFMSMLCAVIGAVASLVLVLSFWRQNFLFAVFGALLAALVVYIVSILFQAIADGIRISMKVTEKISHENH